MNLNDFELLPLIDRNEHDLIITYSRMRLNFPWRAEFNGVEGRGSSCEQAMRDLVGLYISRLRRQRED